MKLIQLQNSYCIKATANPSSTDTLAKCEQYKNTLYMQTDKLQQKPVDPPFIQKKKTGIDVATQVEDYELFDFDGELTLILNVICTNTLEQACLEIEQEKEFMAMYRFKEAFEKRRFNKKNKQHFIVDREKELIDQKTEVLKKYCQKQERNAKSHFQSLSTCNQMDHLKNGKRLMIREWLNQNKRLMVIKQMKRILQIKKELNILIYRRDILGHIIIILLNLHLLQQMINIIQLVIKNYKQWHMLQEKMVHIKQQIKNLKIMESIQIQITNQINLMMKLCYQDCKKEILKLLQQYFVLLLPNVQNNIKAFEWMQNARFGFYDAQYCIPFAQTNVNKEFKLEEFVKQVEVEDPKISRKLLKLYLNCFTFIKRFKQFGGWYIENTQSVTKGMINQEIEPFYEKFSQFLIEMYEFTLKRDRNIISSIQDKDKEKDTILTNQELQMIITKSKIPQQKKCLCIAIIKTTQRIF